MSPFRGWLAALGRRAQRYRKTETQRSTVVLVLALCLAGLAFYLVLGPKPWSAGVAAASARGSDIIPRHYFVTWFWWAALGNAALLVAALATSRRWLQLDPAPTCPAVAPPAARPSRTWAALLAGALLTGGVLAAPRLSYSFWTDEISNMMRAIDGYWDKDDADQLVFRPVSWIDTVWYYRMPNNHAPHSILARLSLDAWQWGLAEDGEPPSEFAVRLPAFAAGIASIASCGWLLWRAGFPAAGIVAAWLLALHPWHLRYASEARGYSMMLFLLTAHLALLLAVLYRGTWRRWLAYGGAQMLLLWTYPGVALHLALTNLGALALLFQLHRGTATVQSQLTRWAAVTIAGAMLWFQAIAPHIPQLLLYMEGDLRYGDIAGRWLRHIGSFLYVGAPWKVPARFGSDYPQLLDPARGGVPWPLVAGAVFASGLVAVGVVRLWLGGFAHRVLAAVLLLPGPLTWLAAWLGGVHLRHWYLLFMLPAWGSLLALGISWPVDSRSRAVRSAGVAAILAAAVAFTIASTPARERLRSISLQPRIEALALSRPSLDPRAPAQAGVLTASFSRPSQYYDPLVITVRTPDDLRALMSRADREGLELFLDLGAFLRDRRVPADLKEFTLEGDAFAEEAVLLGFAPEDTRHVYRYRGSTGQGATSRKSGTSKSGSSVSER